MLKFLWVLLFGRSCPHLWQIVVEREFPSVVERIHATGCRNEIGYDTIDFKRLHWALLKCDKCGATKEFSLRA